MKWLIPFLFLITAAQADSITTGNLLPNAGDGVDWGSTSTEQINPGSSGTVSNGATLNGFDVNCPASQSSCGYKFSVGGDFEVTGTATLSVDDIPLTNNNRTQEMLDNGITLNSYVDVANCDSQPGNCEGKSGNADSHTLTIELKDSSGTVLSTTTQTRTEIVGFQGNCNGYPTSNSGGQTANCGQYNDRLIYNNHGSNKVDWSWSGTDNNSGSAARGGPNLLGAALTMTYDDTVLDNNTSTALGDVQDTLGDLQEDVFDDVQEFFFEEETFTFTEEPQFEMEMPMEMDTFQFAEEFIQEFFMEIDQEFMMEPEGMELEDGSIVMFADETMMEEIYEETEEIVATFLPMVSEKEEVFNEEKSFVENDGPVFMEPTEGGETFQEEELIEEESPMVTESFPEEEMIKEEPTEMAEEEMIEEEPTEMAEEESVEEKPTKMVKQTNEKKEIKKEKPTSKVTKKSAVQTKKITKQKEIQQKKALVKNIARVMEKVDKDIKNISKNLQIKNIIKMQAMTTDQVSLDMYQATSFYKPKDIYLDQLNLIDNRIIYPNKSLATYIQNDKMEIKARKLQEINSRKQQILMELEVLQNG
jgi:outer membrane biosynthesis protein TonB